MLLVVNKESITIYSGWEKALRYQGDEFGETKTRLFGHWGEQ